MPLTLQNKRVYVAGHNGMVGRALVRRLQTENCEILTAARDKLDLRNQLMTANWIKENKLDIIFLSAATVGGINANRLKPAEFLYDNLMIAANIIHAAKEHGVKKLLFLGSSCIYPKHAVQPINEEALLTGSLEPTNEWYAIAKIAGLKLAESYQRQYGCNFISCMPTNLYGPYDNYDLNNSHVLPALIRKIYEAHKQQKPYVILWGSGKPRREFLYVDDLADACVFLIKHYSKPEIVNVGVGKDTTIKELAELIADIIGYKGEFIYDATMPDGTPQKLLDTSKLENLGWKFQTDLREGIQKSYQAYIAQETYDKQN